MGSQPETRARVVLAQCRDYSPHSVQSAVDDLLRELGGLAAYAPRGATVLLKPNLLSARTPDEGVTTHPEVARALIRAVRAAGAHPVVADSACHATQIEQVWERTGYKALCAEEGVPLLNLEQAGSKEFRWQGFAYSVAKPVLEAGLVLNLPKLKTHLLTGLTNAVKNLFGTVPGYQKTLLHKQLPTPRLFGGLLADLYARVRPGLTVCDAVIAMDGPGPSAGRLVPLGLLAASADGVALDAGLCRLLRLSPKAVPYLAPLARAGQGIIDPARIEWAGWRPESWPPQRFRMPRTSVFLNAVPAGPLQALGRFLWIRPSFTDACRRCGLCVRACPVRALALPSDGGRPRLDASRCIGCCCCHEICPHRAVVMARSGLLTVKDRVLKGLKRRTAS